jgi:uncharacterized repeat protein (TIGR01451 family)
MRQIITDHASESTAGQSACPTWPDPWRMALIALCTLILCSCRSPIVPRDAMSPAGEGGNLPHMSRGPGGVETLPAEAYAGEPAAMAAAPMGPPGMEAGVPQPYSPHGPWSPPGIRQPWPEDEYLRDGGDGGRPIGINGRKEILGLKMEDAAAHYDTLDGRTIVEPSNEVYLYSPRFGAVRQVVGLVANEERQQLGDVHNPQRINAPTHLQLVKNAKQNIQAGDQIGARPAVALRTKQGDGAVSSVIGPRGFQDAFKPFENLAVIRLGVFQESETAFLARGSNAAIAWSHTQAVQIILDHQAAMAEVKYDDAKSVYTVTTPPGNPRLRLVKVASTPFAKPGEYVDFTIRFDNTGDEAIGNVTVLDSLSTRLEFVPGSAQCSLDAQFSTQPNEGDSVVVRCEVAKPLAPGKGGVLRFRCRVR